MYRLKLMEPLFLQTETKAETKERALEILQCVEPILECQKGFWRVRIKELFKQFVEGNEDPIELAEDRKNGLMHKFHRLLFYGMCAVYQGE